MTPSAYNTAAAILRDCSTLADADERLQAIESSRAIRWGLFDGWHGRAKTTAGLGVEPTSSALQAKYDEGYALGASWSERK